MNFLINGKTIFKQLFFLLLLLSQTGQAIAQDNQPLRVEFSSFGRNDAYSLVLAEENGLLVLRNDGKSKDNQIIWRFYGYSVNMERMWKSTISVGKDFSLNKKFYRKGYVHLLFTDISNKESRMQHLHVNMTSGEVKIRKFLLENKLQIKDFKVADSSAYILGLNTRGLKNFLRNVFKSNEKKGRRLRFLRYDWEQDKLHNLSDSMATGLRPKRLHIFDHKDQVDVFMAKAINELQDELWMYSFDYSNNLMQRYKFKPVSGKNIVELIVSSQGKDRFVAATMSGLRDRYDRYEDYTDGLYFSVYTGGKEAISRFHKLSNLVAFYNKADPDMFRFFPGKKQLGNSIGYQLNLHPQIKGDGDEMILLAEAYYPEYHTEWYYDAYGMAHTRNIFDGYRFTHALAVAFDREAKVAWDESLEINGVKSYSRARRVEIIADGKNAGIVYNLDNELHYQTLSNGKAKENPATVTLPMLHKDDQLKSSEDGRIQKWYGDYLLASGYQKIDHKSKGNREVFYIFKIGFQ